MATAMPQVSQYMLVPQPAGISSLCVQASASPGRSPSAER